MESGVVISERGVDWITATARVGSSADRLEALGLALLDNARRDGDKCGTMGFQGYSGQSSRHIFCGRRSDGVCVRAGSNWASEHYVDILAEADNCSRVDLAVTAFDPTASIQPADDYWNIADADDPESPILPSVSRTQKRWGGYTTYIGSRSSELMARVYDKHAQSKGEYGKGSWRWELEIKGEYAKQEASHLLADPTRESRIPAIIAEQFQRWNLLVPWDPGGNPQLWRTPPRVSDLDRSARWLSHQYRKTAQWYVERYGLRAFLRLFNLDEQTMNGDNAK